MASTKQHYLKALLALLKEEKGATKSLSHLEKVMLKRGHKALMLPVLKATLRELSKRTENSKPRLTLARQSDKSKFAKKYKDAEIVLDENIIGGYIYEEAGTRLDNSYKTRLLNWYHNTLNNK